MLSNRIDVLDKGYVILQDHMGNDLTVANAARVSFNKKKTEMSEKDERLISFLAEHEHTSPFRHAYLQFEVYAPLFVARQHFKYVVGSSHQDPMMAWNESSRRYVTEEPEFYIPQPSEWRSAPDNNKQGSGGPLADIETAFNATGAMKEMVGYGLGLYQGAMDIGVCAEQARMFLPAYALYVRYYWSASLAGVCHFLNQRLAHDAQKEITDYAEAVLKLAKEHFPVSIEKMVKA